MQFVAKTKPLPYKIIPILVPNEYTWLPNGDLKVVETQKKEVYLTKEEAVKVLASLNERIKFHEYEISREYIDQIKGDIDNLKILKKSWEMTLNNK